MKKTSYNLYIGKSEKKILHLKFELIPVIYYKEVF